MPRLLAHVNQKLTLTELDATEGSLSTSAGLKKDFFFQLGEVGGEEPLEKLEVDVQLPLEWRLSILLELSKIRVQGASCVSEYQERNKHKDIATENCSDLTLQITFIQSNTMLVKHAPKRDNNQHKSCRSTLIFDVKIYASMVTDRLSDI